MSIVKIWLVLLIGIEAGAERIRPAEVVSVQSIQIKQRRKKCGCKCEQSPGEMAKLATLLSDIVSAVQAQERQEIHTLLPLLPLR